MLLELSFLILLPIILAVLGFMTFFVERDNPLGATSVLIGTGLVLQFFTTIQPFTMIMANPASILGFLAIYLAFGIGYGMFKWYRYLRVLLADYAVKRAEYLKSNKLVEADMTKSEREYMVAALSQKIVGRGRSLPPKVSEHKSRVTTWMAYWPLSLTWMLLDDLVIGIWEWTYNRVADILQGLSARVFAPFKNDFK
jgi:hypothetical protein